MPKNQKKRNTRNKKKDEKKRGNQFAPLHMIYKRVSTSLRKKEDTSLPIDQYKKRERQTRKRQNKSKSQYRPNPDHQVLYAALLQQWGRQATAEASRNSSKLHQQDTKGRKKTDADADTSTETSITGWPWRRCQRERLACRGCRAQSPRRRQTCRHSCRCRSPDRARGRWTGRTGSRGPRARAP